MSSLYLFYGDDLYLLKKEAEKIVAEKNVDEFNTTRYTLQADNEDEIINELMTVSFLADEKLMVLSNPSFLQAKPEKTGFVGDMIKFIESKQTDTTLIMIKEGKVDSDFLTLLKNSGCYVREIKNLYGEDLKNYIIAKLTEEGYTINSDAVAILLERTKEDTLLVFNELEKLKLGSDDKTITADLVKLMVSKDLDDNIYDLLSAFLERDTKKVMKIYTDFTNSHEDELRILNAVMNKLEEIYYTKVLMKQGLSKDDIAGYFKVKPGRAYYMMANAKSVSDSDLRKLMKRASKLDLDIKSGMIDKKQGLELFLLGA